MIGTVRDLHEDDGHARDAIGSEGGSICSLGVHGQCVHATCQGTFRGETPVRKSAVESVASGNERVHEGCDLESSEGGHDNHCQDQQ